MKKLSIGILTALVFILMLNTSNIASANNFGNEWVYDEPQVVSHETEAYIKTLNEDVFVNYKNKPQLAIVVINTLPYNIDDYKRDVFNDYGVGNAEENCGMLFLFAINDREYALEIGDGFDKGSLLRKDLETDFITEDMKNSLREGNYDSVILQIAKHLEGIMADEENGVYAQREADKLAEQKAREEQIAATAAAIKKDLKLLSIILCIACPAAGFIALAVYLIRKYLRKQKIAELIDLNYKYLSMAQTTEEEFTAYLKEMHSDIPTAELEKKFLELLYEVYLDKQTCNLAHTASSPQHFPMYEYALKDTNNFHAFKRCELTDLNTIIHKVDEEERQKAEMENKNVEIIDRYLEENEHRIVHKNLLPSIRNTLRKNLLRCDRLIQQDELEASFSDTLNELNFRWEVDQFLAEHSDQASGQYFSQDNFYHELYSSEHYQNYHYTSNYDRSWMLPMLLMHKSNREKAHREALRRREEERKAREKRQREEARRREQERMNSNNSSFGSGFGGGHSSGGGFKGGW